MIEAAGAGDDGLLRRQPAIGQDALRHDLPGLDLRILHIDGADAELLVAEAVLVVMAMSCSTR